MPIDYLNEQLLTVPEAAGHFPVPVSETTAWRYVLYGTADGVRLESLKAGGRRFTSLEAIARFIARTSGDPLPSAPTPKQRERAIAEAGKVLDEAGI